MKIGCYEVARGYSDTRLLPYINIDPDVRAIVLGEEGRGREMTVVRIPDHAVIDGDKLISADIAGAPANAALVVIRDHSGYRGGWRLRMARTTDEWDLIARRAAAHRPPNGYGPLAEGHTSEMLGRCEKCDDVGQVPPEKPASNLVVAEGWCAQGLAGRMGGGPEYLLLLREGQAVEIVRWGRLYGQPDVIQVRNDDGNVTITFPKREAISRLAHQRLLSIAQNE